MSPTPVPSELDRLARLPAWEWPSSAADVILGSLRDTETTPSGKLIAARLAGDLVVMNDEIADALLAIVQNGDSDEKLRGAAAIAFGAVLEEVDIDGFNDFEPPSVTEATFHRIQDTLKKVYFDGAAPVLVRRRALEASIREPRDWHAGAVAAAWATGDRNWQVTAVFAMGWMPGFEDQIVEALESEDELLLSEAVTAAGMRELDAAWPVVTRLLSSRDTDKNLLVAAIEAACSIRPKEARSALSDALRSNDEDIAELAQEALDMAEALSGNPWDDEDFF